jgi:hypothetical protein
VRGPRHGRLSTSPPERKLAAVDDDTRRRFKEIATQRFALFLEGVDKGQFGTLILTTDGERYRVTDIAHPLPERYLE